jgi:type I restriction enzyme S subunit
METRYTKTTPKGWNLKTVEQVFDFYPTASYSRDKMFKDNNPSAIGYIHYGDIHTKYNLILDVPNTEIPYISEELKKDFEYIKEGDLILSDTSEDYDGVGKCIEILNVGNNKIISGLHTLMLRPKGNDLIDGFKGYLFSGEYVRNSLLRIVTGIKVYSIAKAMLAKVNLPIPSIQEQKEITNILSKVDKAIASVQNSIAAAERLKKSLMQNLLTGKMKPDGTFRTSEEFYIDEKFGKVPVGWEVKKLKDIASIQRGKFGHRPRNDERYYNGDFPFVQTSDVVESVLYLKSASQSLNELGASVSKRFPQNTIIMTIAANIGYVALTRYEVYFPDSLIGINANENIVKPTYLLFQLMGFKNVLDALATESAQKNINYSNLRSLPILFPTNIEEQLQIAKRIIKTFKVIEKKKSKIDILERLKKSLMQNLLTGKVTL